MEGVAVDVGDVVVDQVGESIFKLSDLAFGVGDRCKLDGDSAAIGIGLVGLRVRATICSKNLHWTRGLRYRPEIDWESARRSVSLCVLKGGIFGVRTIGSSRPPGPARKQQKQKREWPRHKRSALTPCC